jgi:hypothetical protein
MAEAGLQAFNDSGVLQIDSTYRNMRLAEKGVLQTGPRAPLNSPQLLWGSNLISLPLPSSVLAWRCPARCTLVTYTPVPGVAQYGFFTESASVVEWWRFDVSPPAASNFGIQVFNSAAELVFDSGDVSAKVLDVFESSIAPTPPPYNVEGIPRTYSGKKIAVVQNNAAGLLTGFAGSPGGIMRMAYTARMPDDATVVIDYYMVEFRTQAPPFFGTRTTSHPNYMVMDVTGL